MDPDTHRHLLARRQVEGLRAAHHEQLRRDARQARRRTRPATRIPRTRARLAAVAGRLQRALDPGHGHVVDRAR